MGRNSSWDDYRMSCMHGVREGLDSHDCASCHAIAVDTGADVSNGRTYLYKKDPRAALPKIEKAAPTASPDCSASDIRIDYAADDSCTIRCWAKGHFEVAKFLEACEAALKAWDGRDVTLTGKAVEHSTWRTVRAPQELSSYGVCEFIHVDSKPGRGAYPVTQLTEWLELHDK